MTGLKGLTQIAMPGGTKRCRPCGRRNSLGVSLGFDLEDAVEVGDGLEAGGEGNLANQLVGVQQGGLRSFDADFRQARVLRSIMVPRPVRRW
jgi:hypothetical protein